MNKIVLMGRLVAAPELKTTPNGISVCSVTVACDRSFRSQSGERQSDFIDVVAWRNTAEFLSKYFVKGQLVLITGELQTRTYTDKNGNNRKAVEVVADAVHFTGDRRDSSQSNQYNNSYSQPSMPQEPATYLNGTPSDFESIPSDDDLPF